MNTRLSPTHDRLQLEREARARDKEDRLGDALPMSHYRDVRAWVLLADPGAGKSDVFTTLALSEGGTCVIARDFVAVGAPADWQEPLFIDGLDEINAGSSAGMTPLELIRKTLHQLGTPKFRISCREADWRGNADGAGLKRLVGDDNFAELHLAPLTYGQSVALVAHWQASIEAQAEIFMQEAENCDLEGLLDNPQTLLLLVKAHEANGNGWPTSKTQTYELACEQLVREHNGEHLANTRDNTLPDNQTLLAAGYLCAVMLLSGSGAIALQRQSQPRAGVVILPELNNAAPARDLPTCRVALHTRLFRGNGTGDFWPVHRTVAEYLGAHYLASRIKAGLPASRVLALMLGEDGGLVPELRGLHAWLAAVTSPDLRRELIAHDPLGVVLNGDVRAFSRTDKLAVLEALQHEASQDSSFRRQNWISHPFGALATADMEADFKALLQSADRSPAHQAVLGCVLDALAHGQPMPALTPVLGLVVRDKSYWSSLRTAALEVLVIYANAQNDTSTLTQLLAEIRSNVVEDQEDELLGNLLQVLYPNPIPPTHVFQYFREPRAENLLGSYWQFWHELPKKSVSHNEIASLLDSLVGAGYRLKNEHDHLGSAHIVGELLAYGVRQHGTRIEVKRLYSWLSLCLGPHEHCPLSAELKSALREWLSGQPARYKALFEHGLHLLQTAEDDNAYRNLWRVRARLYGATEPEDAASWYVSLAKASSQDALRQQLVTDAFQLTHQREGADAAIQLVEHWAANHPIDTAWAQNFLCCPYPPEESDQAYIDSEIKHKIEKDERNRQRINFFQKTLPSFEHGPAHLGALAEVANVYLNFFRQSKEESPYERLLELLNQNKDWVHLSLHGLRQSLFRDDLPTAAAILKLHAESRRYNLATPCLAAMELRYAEDAATALDLPSSTLETVAAFRLTNNFYESPEWFKQLLAQRPEVLIKVMTPLISQQIAAKSEHIEGLYSLARNADYATVAKQIVPQLIADFPIKASQKQLKNLRLLVVAVLKHLDQPTQLTVIAKKLNAKGIDVAQQAYWLTAGTLLAPELYIERMREFANRTQARTSQVFALIHELKSFGSTAELPITTQALLAGLLGPRCSRKEPHSGAYFVTPEMEMGDYVAGLISNLSNNPDNAATQALSDLQQRHDMKQWHDALKRALYDQRIARRKALFKPATVKQVCATLANLQPASAADLWALTVDHLTQLAKEIRNGSTNDYRQYWANDKPKLENDCRDALLSDLKQCLTIVHVAAEREGNYADDKRADIKVIASPHHIPIEIKRESHPDLWKAIGNQLIEKYDRESASDGYGIYLVFWFSGQMKAVPTDGGHKPKNPQELQQRLQATVPEALKHKIAVLVVDCARPPASQK